MLQSCKNQVKNEKKLGLERFAASKKDKDLDNDSPSLSQVS
jgi:hypothetical protein